MIPFLKYCPYNVSDEIVIPKQVAILTIILIGSDLFCINYCINCTIERILTKFLYNFRIMSMMKLFKKQKKSILFISLAFILIIRNNYIYNYNLILFVNDTFFILKVYV